MAPGPVVTCPACGAEARLAPGQVGQTVACPGCGQAFTTAAAPISCATPAATSAATPMSVTAVLSLIAGCLFCVPGVGLVATVLGGVGLAHTAQGRARGRGLAIAGLVLCVVGLGVSALQVTTYLRFMSMAGSMAAAANNQVRSMANLQQIGQALAAYQGHHGGAPPADFADLLAAEPTTLTVATFVDPRTADTPADDAAHLLAGGHCSYTYVRPSADAGPQAIVAYGSVPAANFPGRPFTVLRNDRNVEQRQMPVPAPGATPH